MDDPTENEISSFKRFLEIFCRDVEEPSSEENDSPIRHVSYMLEPSEIEGESLRWALDYLCQTHECPHGLAEQVAREAFLRAVHHDLQNFFHSPTLSMEESSHPATGPRIEIRRLQREIQIHVYRVCTEWNQQLPAFVRPPPPLFPVSVHAIKNTRRRMEDRHVILPDLNTLFQLQDRPRLSYYAVFDGHGGAEAAMFAASQLHVNLLRDPSFHSNPELALKRAYSTTDRQFLRKADEMKLGCGTTGVSMLLRGDTCYVTWLGDSQVMLVREGRAVTLMDPHKPDREDEQRRIEQLGGFVVNCAGVWRVRGNISVSRAIGDLNEKPYLCSDADVTNFKVTGAEDYVVLACDGIWDVMDPADVPFLVHSFLAQHPGHHHAVARHLVTRAKEMRSTDNISCVVVFLREDVAPPVGVPLEGLQFVHENGGGHGNECGSSDVSAGSQKDCGASTTSGSTGSSVLTVSSGAVVEGRGEVGVGTGGGSLYSPGRQIVSDFPHKLERQTGFFFPSLRSMRTGLYRQQLVPLQEGKAGREPGVSRDNAVLTLDILQKEEQAYRNRSLSKGSSSKRGSTKRRSKQKRRRGRLLTRPDSPDSSLALESVSADQSVGDGDMSLASFGPSRSVETLAKHTSLAEILQQMADPVDENTNPNSSGGDMLSVRGMSARLHNALPRIPSRPPSNLLNSTTSMTPVSTSRLPLPSSLLPEPARGKGKPRPFNLK
ncbi:protein phosphatase 1F-like [Babylonia areolata]|uniref:protein phosphatase 1F-like n=1 Tax=Babylonia areolata TaxID=304850 RepID=UPI003FD291D3